MNSYDDDMDRPEKSKCRDWLIDVHFRRKRPAKVALFFPAMHCRCIRQAYAAGVIDRHTKIIAIERDAERAAAIEVYLAEYFDEWYIHTDKAETCELSAVCRGFGKIELAYFDFCGPLSDSIIYWLMMEKSWAIASKAKLGFTFSVGRRGHCLVNELETNVKLRKWLDHITGFADNGSGLTHSASIPTLSILKYLMGSACKVIRRREYCDERTPMLFVAMTQNGESDWDEMIHDNKILTDMFDFPECVKKNCDAKQKGIWYDDMKDFTTADEVGKIVERFRNAGSNVHKLAGAKRAATCYAQRRSNETGQDEYRFKAAIKAVLARNGLQGAY